ncbi:beta strand repeat-containing protein, partial [Thermodesulfobacteriota bacterium]
MKFISYLFGHYSVKSSLDLRNKMINKTLFALALCLISVFFLCVGHVYANTWWGNIDSDWNNPNNWQELAVPPSGDDVVIDTLGYGPYNPTYSSGTLDVNSLTVNSGSTLTLTGGTFNIAADSGVTTGGTITLSNGTFGGAGNMTVNGTFTWSSGTVSVATLSTTGTANLSGTADKDLGDTTWTNTGTVNWTNGDLDLAGGTAIFNNDSVFNIVNTETNYDIKGAGTFNNNATGTINKADTGNIYIQPVGFTNAGTVNIDVGRLIFPNATTITQGFDIASGATIEFNSNTHTINTASPAIAGSAGTLQITNATVNFNTAGTSLPASVILAQTGGTLGGSSGVTVSGTYNWSGGAVSVATLSTTGTANLSGTADKDLGDTTWTNTGTVNWTNGDLDLAGGTAIFNNDSVFNIVTTDGNDDIKGAGTFNNTATGTINKADTGN